MSIFFFPLFDISETKLYLTPALQQSSRQKKRSRFGFFDFSWVLSVRRLKGGDNFSTKTTHSHEMAGLFYSSGEKCLLSDSPFSRAFIMSSHLTSKCAGLLSNIPSKQTALWMADINLPQCCEKVLGLGAAESREERKRVRFHSWNFRLSSHLKTSQRCLVRGPHKHVHVFLVFLTCALH